MPKGQFIIVKRFRNAAFSHFWLKLNDSLGKKKRDK